MNNTSYFTARERGEEGRSLRDLSLSLKVAVVIRNCLIEVTDYSNGLVPYE
jgi:hypothetical protein